MAKKNSNTTSIGFEDAIWKAADKLRGNLNASEYEGVMITGAEALAMGKPVALDARAEERLRRALTSITR